MNLRSWLMLLLDGLLMGFGTVIVWFLFILIVFLDGRQIYQNWLFNNLGLSRRYQYDDLYYLSFFVAYGLLIFVLVEYAKAINWFEKRHKLDDDH